MNEQALLVECPDCSDQFRVLFNGEEIVRCPNRDCTVYLYLSIQDQKEAQLRFILTRENAFEVTQEEPVKAFTTGEYMEADL